MILVDAIVCKIDFTDNGRSGISLFPLFLSHQLSFSPSTRPHLFLHPFPFPFPVANGERGAISISANFLSRTVIYLSNGKFTFVKAAINRSSSGFLMRPRVYVRMCVRVCVHTRTHKRAETVRKTLIEIVVIVSNAINSFSGINDPVEAI